MPPEAESDQGTFAYLLLTHKDPSAIEELAARILELSPRGNVVVHHDLASDQVPWAGSRPPSRVHMVERGRVLWGDWSIVEATLRMLRFSTEHLHADWFVVISGEHRPVVDLEIWERAVLGSGVDAYVDAEPLPRRLRFGRDEEDANRFLARCRHRWVTVAEPQATIAHRALAGAWKLSRYVQPCVALEYSHRRRAWFVGTPRRQSRSDGWTFYKGSQWIAFNRRSARAILEPDPRVTQWFRHGHIPDETYLQTLLHHQAGLVVQNRAVTYVPPGPERPTPVRWMVLDLDDLPSVWESGAAFARKVDPVCRPEVLRAMDDEVDRRRHHAAATSPGEGGVR